MKMTNDDAVNFHSFRDVRKRGLNNVQDNIHPVFCGKLLAACCGYQAVCTSAQSKLARNDPVQMCRNAMLLPVGSSLPCESVVCLNRKVGSRAATLLKIICETELSPNC